MWFRPFTHSPACSDLSDNSFTANLPIFHSNASVSIALLQNNYFTSGVSNLVKSGVCASPSTTVTLGSNCLTSTAVTSPGSSCDVRQQRIDSICNVTCALCPSACYFVGASAIPTCPCPNSSYVVLKEDVPACLDLGMSKVLQHFGTSRLAEVESIYATKIRAACRPVCDVDATKRLCNLFLCNMINRQWFFFFLSCCMQLLVCSSVGFFARLCASPPTPPPPIGVTPISFCFTPDNIFLQPFVLAGSAKVTQGLLFTKPDRTGVTSFALLPSPVTLFDNSTCKTATLNTSFTLSIDPAAASTGGVTFAILQSSAGPGSYFSGGLGYNGSGVGLSVEFDVWKDAWDPDGNHIGLNIGGNVQSVATASLNFSLLGPEPTFVWITYESPDKVLRVYASKQSSPMPDTPVLLYYVSLCVLLRDQPLSSASTAFYVGFTGEGSMQPAIRNWCFSAGKAGKLVEPGNKSHHRRRP